MIGLVIEAGKRPRENSPELPTYEKEMFERPDKECDIIMKGGITSGVVYPYAILELAKVYRFKSIGGTSAGAIAAAFAAAAEYARTVGKDPAGFVRLQEKCDELPDKLTSLFQPTWRFRPVMRHFLRSQRWKHGSLVWAVPLAFPLTTIAGGTTGWWLMRIGDGTAAGVSLGAAVGAIIALLLRILKLVLLDLPGNNFGMCTGRTMRRGGPHGLTDWMHEALQYIAFSDAKKKEPLTFGDLQGTVEGVRVINLKMVTTNLSMQRPHTLPGIGIPGAAFDLAQWTRLFPDDVMDHLKGSTAASTNVPGKRGVPNATDLPVLVAMRMSLSFPFLFEAIPLHAPDFISAMYANATKPLTKVPWKPAKIWLADGGISSNFPIHMFDAFLPARPTFALSLDTLPRGDLGENRVFIPEAAGQGVGLRVNPIQGLLGFGGSIIASAKDWQDQLLSTMPGHRETIAHVMLSDDEGGLNLAMPPKRSRSLMDRGRQVGEEFAKGALDFDEHKWRRALVAYDQLEDVVAATGHTWVQRDFGAWLEDYMPDPKSYDVPDKDKAHIHTRLGLFAALATHFAPGIVNKRKKLPNPRGRLRVDPDY